jgi:hypothetical protein
MNTNTNKIVPYLNHFKMIKSRKFWVLKRENTFLFTKKIKKTNKQSLIKPYTIDVLKSIRWYWVKIRFCLQINISNKVRNSFWF